jgi:hypothetical protein
MSAVGYVIWFICMTLAVFAVLVVGVYMAAKSGNPEARKAREHASSWLHLPHLHLPHLHRHA